MRSSQAAVGFLLAVLLMAGFSNALTSTDAIALTEMARIFPLFAMGGYATVEVNPEGQLYFGGAWKSSYDTSDYLQASGCIGYGLCADSAGSKIDVLRIDLLWARAVNASSISPSSIDTSALANLSITQIYYTIPPNLEDEQVLAPFIFALLRAFSTSQITFISVIGTPRVTTQAGTNIYDPVWLWESLTTLRLELPPTTFPVTSPFITYLWVSATNFSVVNPDGYGAIVSLTLIDHITGVTSTDSSIRNSMTSLTTLTMTMPATPITFNVGAIPLTLNRLTLIGLDGAFWNSGTFSLVNMDYLKYLTLRNVAGDDGVFVAFSVQNTIISSLTLDNVSVPLVRQLFCSQNMANANFETLIITTPNQASLDLANDLCFTATTYNALKTFQAPISWASIPSVSAYADVFSSTIQTFYAYDTPNNASSVSFSGIAGAMPGLITLSLTGSSLSSLPSPQSMSTAFSGTMTAIKYLSVTGSSLGGISGTLPTTFWTDLTSSGAGGQGTNVNVKLSGHRYLVGSIPSTGFTYLNTLDVSYNGFTEMEALQSTEITGKSGKGFNDFYYLNVSNNNLQSILNDDDLSVLSSLTELVVENNPELSFALPSIVSFDNSVLRAFLAANTSLYGTMASTIPVKLVKLDVSNTLLTGGFPELFSNSGALSGLGLLSHSYRNTALSGTIPDSWSYETFLKLDLSNTGVTRDNNQTLPIANTPFVVTYYDISNTSISGDFLGFYYFRRGVLLADSLPNVDFCAVNPLPYYVLPPTKCSIDYTSLCSHTSNAQCLSTYYNMGCISVATCPPSSAPVPTPTLAPTNAPVAPVALACALPAPTAGNFSCVNGKWVTLASITATALTLPSSAGVITIGGNLATGTVNFNGIATSLVIEGCVKYLPNVVVSIDAETLANLHKSGNTKTVTLASISPNSTCANSTVFDGVALSLSTASSASSSCRTVSVSKQRTSSASLVAVFTLDNSKCNRWWVILVSVICSVVFVVIIVILIVKFVPAVQTIVRPFKGTDSRL